MQRNTAEYNLLIARTRMHISDFFQNFLPLQRGSVVIQLFFNSLENEPVSVTRELIQLWKQTGWLKSDETFTDYICF